LAEDLPSRWNLDAKGTVEEATRLETATTSLFGKIYRELVEDEPPAAAAAGDGLGA
jgi:hypothetical protein